MRQPSGNHDLRTLADMNRRHTLSLLAVTGSGFALAGCRGDPADALIGKAMPALSVTALSGERFNLAELGRPALIRFWGLWCAPCLRDEPNWRSAVEHIRTDKDLKDMVIVSVHVGEAPKQGPSLARWAERQPRESAIPVVDDARREVFDAVGVPGTPCTLLVDAGGTIEGHSWTLRHARGARAFVGKVRTVLG
jgi:thiol-disulfide isomerase/thioredoxin